MPQRTLSPSPSTMDRRRIALFFLLPLLSLSVSANDPDNQCVYTVYIRTGSGIKAGTDSKIGLTFGDETGNYIMVKDIETSWGLMGSNYDYFERGNLDIFSGRGPCLSPPLCRLNLTSDGTGSHHGWYCEYVEVTSTGPHVPCSQTLFYVQQWLATDAAPYKLYATVDGCGKTAVAGKGKLIVGGGGGSSAE